MCRKKSRAARNDQECTPGNSLDIAAETENESRDKIYDAPGLRIVHVLQVDDYRNFLAIVLTDGGGIPEVSRTYYRDLDIVAHGMLATPGLIIVMDPTQILGSIPVVVDQGTVTMLDATEPSAGVALHYANLRRYEPIHDRPSGKIMVDGRNRSEPGCIKP
jgi:hypothetical protein